MKGKHRMTMVNAVEAVVSTKKPSNGNTLIHVVLDETGSMNSCWDSTISSFNEFIGGQKSTAAGECNVSLSKFSTSGYGYRGLSLQQGSAVRDLFVNVSVQNAPLLTRTNYTPNGGTNLYDAIGSTVRRIEAQLAPQASVPNVLVVIITDGEENSSQEFTQAGVRELIKAKEQEGWTFLYLGANQDAFQAGSGLGLAKGQTMTYSTNNMDATMSTLSAATSSYRSVRAQAFAAGNNSAEVAQDFFGVNGIDLTKNS
jgi:hypothetical protein